MKRVLIVEDDQIVGSIYRRKFQAEGFEVTVAVDGEAGLKSVNEFQPDVIVLDLMLPRLNGVEVLRSLRSTTETASLPVIVLSNAYLSTLMEDAKKAGAFRCLIKANCTPKQVIGVVREALGAPPPAATSQPSTPPAASLAPTPPTPAQQNANLPTKPTPPPEEATTQIDLRQAFLGKGEESVAQLRGMLQAFVKSEGDASRLPNLFALYRRVHSITSNAGVVEITDISRLCAALEALLKELYEKPKNINASSIRTIAQTIDLLATVFAQTDATAQETSSQPKILVVDDEAISRRAIVYALEKANLRCINLDDPKQALEKLAQEPFDLIFLDVDMPGTNGFDVCTQLRTFEANAKTPVIFVTGLTDFESRARSTLSGGSDLIAKPFLFMELAVKAISQIIRSQLNS